MCKLYVTMGVQERAKNRKQMENNRLITELLEKTERNDLTIKNQSKVIKESWSELQQLKRILIDDYPQTWRQIQKQINK